ncbi:MAG: efflux RND transporter periplasmic adaptor subunit [Chthonomonadales bacterium]
MNRKIVWTAAASTLAVIGVAAALMVTLDRNPAAKAKSSEPEEPKAIPVAFYTVEPVGTTSWLDATGTVRPEFEAVVATKVSGRVMSVLVHEGDHVRKGQPLVLLDARDLDAGIVQAQANLRSAEVGYQNARVAADMETSMSRSRVQAAEAELKQAEAALQAATARQQQVDTGPRKQERAQASLAVLQAKANLDLAESNLRRMQSLVADGAISQQQYDITRTARDVAKAQYEAAVQQQSMVDEGSRAEERRQAQEAVRQAQAAVAQAQAGLRQAKAAALQAEVRREEVKAAKAQVGQMRAALQIARVMRDYATIRAPFDGVIAAKLVDPGAMANPGTPLLRVQGGRIRLEAVVPESALKWVQMGSALPVDLDALAGHRFMGRVSEIAPQGDPASHTFVAKVDLPATARIRAGMFGRAHIATTHEHRMLVPAPAVFEREGLHYVFVVDDQNVARLRLVTVGDEVDGRRMVLSGLNPGERIIAQVPPSLTDGAKVLEAASQHAQIARISR